MGHVETMRDLASTRGFLFDLDGTLIDSAPAHERAYVETLSAIEPSFAAKFNYAEHAGRPTADVMTQLLLPSVRSGDLPPASVETAVSAKQERYLDLLDKGVVNFFPGALESLDVLRSAGRRIGLVTGASRRSTESVLQALGFRSFFESIVTADRVSKGKPDPEPFLLGLAEMSLHPKDAFAVEDSENGAVSARAAGLGVILVNGGSCSEDLAFKSIADLAELFKATAWRK